MFGNGLITFQPKQFSNLKLWLDASNVSNGSNPAASSLVSTWTDLSGVTGNATSAGGLRPTFSTGQQNSLPGIQFSGAQSIDVANLAVGSNITAFFVSRSSNNTLFIEQSPNINTSSGGFYIYGAGALPGFVKNNGSGVGPGASSNWLGTSTNLSMLTYNGAQLDLWKNGSSLITQVGVITNNTVTDTLYIGSRGQSALFMTGLVFEVIIYNSVLASPQIAIVNEYLRRKWAIY
jgi:hypothetical protein